MLFIKIRDVQRFTYTDWYLTVSVRTTLNIWSSRFNAAIYLLFTDFSDHLFHQIRTVFGQHSARFSRIPLLAVLIEMPSSWIWSVVEPHQNIHFEEEYASKGFNWMTLTSRVIFFVFGIIFSNKGQYLAKVLRCFIAILSNFRFSSMSQLISAYNQNALKIFHISMKLFTLFLQFPFASLTKTSFFVNYITNYGFLVCSVFLIV